MHKWMDGLMDAVPVSELVPDTACPMPVCMCMAAVLTHRRYSSKAEAMSVGSTTPPLCSVGDEPSCSGRVMPWKPHASYASTAGTAADAGVAEAGAGAEAEELIA